MTDKHTLPASPLPWAMCDAAPNDQWYAGRTFYSVPHGTRIGDLSPLKRHDDLAADGAYMVEACNAYPDLATRITALEAEKAELVRDRDALMMFAQSIQTWCEDADSYDRECGHEPRTYCEDVELMAASASNTLRRIRARATLAKARQSDEGE